MLLGIDIGNTNITFGVFKGEDLIFTFRIVTDTSKTDDELGIIIKSFLSKNNIELENINDSIISSVVPKMTLILQKCIKEYFEINPKVVTTDLVSKIKISKEIRNEVGVDRIVTAVAGFEKYGGPLIIIDYGTASTYDVIDSGGEFLAGVTAPGIEISANALFSSAALLNKVELKKPDSILAKNTITSLQAGIIYGKIGETEYIINRIKKELGYDLKVLATGGLSKIILSETDLIDFYEENLIFDGLRIIAKQI